MPNDMLTRRSVAAAAAYLTSLAKDGCTGYLEFGHTRIFIAHDADTCPVHESDES